MATQTTTPVRCRGRARGLVAVWEEERRARNKWWLQNCLLPRCGRAKTLGMLTNMVSRHAQRPWVEIPKLEHQFWKGVLVIWSL